MKKIMNMNFSPLRMEESYEVNRAASVEFEKCGDDLFAPFKANHRAKFDEFDVALKQPNFVQESEELSALDYQRDNSYKILSYIVDYTRRCDNSERAGAAARIDNILSRYGDPTKQPYMQESASISNLLQDLEQISDDVKIIGAEIWFNDLKRQNADFITLFDERNAQQGALVTGIAKEARLAVEQTFGACIQCLNTLIALNGFETYAGIAGALNNLIDYQKTVIKTRKSHTKSKE